MEADLRRFYGVRYSDRWRFAPDGTRLLTVREIAVLIRDLPGDSRIVKHYNNGRTRWDDGTFLIADLIHAMTGKAHPARPKPPKGTDRRETPQRAKVRRQRIADRRRRQLERQAATAAT
ncbi:hypothetical protein [Rhodococcus jostii]|uniref:hypothetical protein n=1 Tax=Rhodococcus jostii TaxID=132919 RepID=UPI00363D947E